MSTSTGQASQLEASGLCKLNLDSGGAEDRAVLRDLFEHGLAQDAWLPPGHDYRSRAYQSFAVDPRTRHLDFISAPPAYVQAEEVNSIAGGLQRRFRGLPEEHPATVIARRLAAMFLDLTFDSGVAAQEGNPYVLDVHYIRISAPGKPCPEGVHRDGLVAGSVHLVSLANVSGGETHFTNDAGEQRRSFRLAHFLDSVVFDDKRLLHYTADIARVDPKVGGHRDVLLLGLREQVV